MEKKSLGRGLEDIADIFMSQKQENFPADDSASENANEPAVEPCLEHSGGDSEGTMPFSEDDIITVIDKRLKVNRNCFNSEGPSGHDLSGRDEDLQARNTKNTLEDYPDVCEITQHVTSKKKLGYVNTPDVQQNIIKSLFQHLRQDFIISRIELVKVDAVSRPGMNKKIEENISIYINGEENR